MHSKRGERLRDIFVAACEKYPRDDADFRRAVDLMRDWDLKAFSDAAPTAKAAARNISKAAKQINENFGKVKRDGTK